MNAEKLIYGRGIRVVGCMILPALFVGCAYVGKRHVPAAAHAQRPASGYRIAQLGLGDASYFGMCLVPVCPAVTPKTLSAPSAHAGQGRTGEASKAPMPSTLVVHFQTGSALLDATDVQRLSRWSVHAMRAEKITIAGRTDSVGAEALNHRLASARARAVANYLRDQLDVAPARLSWEGRGMCCYVGDNTTDTGRRANRRAEITFHPLMREEP